MSSTDGASGDGGGGGGGVRLHDPLLASHQSAALYDKIGALLLIGVVSFACGMAPLLLGRLRRLCRWPGCRVCFCCCGGGGDDGGGGGDLVMSCVLCTGSGVLLATVFTHMLPEIRDSFQLMQQLHLFPSWTLPPAEMILVAGFMFIYLIEEVVTLLANQRHKHKQHRHQQRHSHHLPTDGGAKYKTFNSPASRDSSPDDAQYQLAVPSAPALLSRFASSPELHRSDSSAPLLAPCSTAAPPPPPLAPLPTSPHLHQLRAYLVVLAISVHALFEGLAVALEKSAAGVWSLTAAILAHKCVICVCVGEQLAASVDTGSGGGGSSDSTGDGGDSRRSVYFVVGNVLLLSLSSSLGIVLGLVVDNGASAGDQLVAAGVLQALAAGTILYVLMFELLVPERAKQDGCGLVRFGAVLAGCCLVMMIQTQVAD